MWIFSCLQRSFGRGAGQIFWQLDTGKNGAAGRPVTTQVWSIFVCHLHLTIISCRTAFRAQACGSERKTSFVTIVHLWFTPCPQSCVVAVGVFGGSNITILLFLVRNIWTFGTVITPFLGVLVNTLQYHDTVTEDPQLVAEQRVGRNHGNTMGKS